MSVNTKMTAIADEIRVLSGATDPLGLDEMATHVEDANTEITEQEDLLGQIVAALVGKSADIDTSDATAESRDIAIGETAYVDGKKVTGSISILAEDAVIDEPSPAWVSEKNAVRTGFKMVSGDRIIIEKNDKSVWLDIEGAAFGDATSADVAIGKTFTSINGLKIVGEMIASVGGMPDGVSALASGTITPTQNYTTRVDVPHGLGVKPNFCIVMMELDLSTTVLASALVGASVIYKPTKYNESSSIPYTAHIMLEGYGSSGQATGSATRAATEAYFTNTTFGIPCNSTYQLINGQKYHWVCGVLDGVL